MTRFPTHRPLAPASKDSRHGERGAALIIAISLLAIMAILGVTLMSVSTSELQLSGNYRNQQEAFLAADRAVEYSINSMTIGDTQVNLNTDSDTSVIPNVPHRDRIVVGNSGLDTTAPNTVDFIGEGTPPIGIGSDANLFKARNYMITVTGASPATAQNPARTTVRAQVARIVAK
jgi:hypothetical protein